MTISNMAKRTAAGTLALTVCLGGAALAFAGSAQAQQEVTVVPTGEFDKPTAVIASGDGAHLVDSVTAGPFASTLAANILLVPQDRMDASTYFYLSDNHIQVVYIVGGKTAVGQVVEDKIRSYGIAVYRLAGADRYETAKVIADVNDLAWESL